MRMVSLVRRETSVHRVRKEILALRLPFLGQLVLPARRVFRVSPVQPAHRLGSRATPARQVHRTHRQVQLVHRVRQARQVHLVAQLVQLVSLGQPEIPAH